MIINSCTHHARKLSLASIESMLVSLVSTQDVKSKVHINIYIYPGVSFLQIFKVYLLRTTHITLTYWTVYFIIWKTLQSFNIA